MNTTTEVVCDIPCREDGSHVVFKAKTHIPERRYIFIEFHSPHRVYSVALLSSWKSLVVAIRKDEYSHVRIDKSSGMILCPKVGEIVLIYDNKPYRWVLKNWSKLVEWTYSY